MKILIIQTAFIGDVILATPIIEKLKRFHPEAQVDFLLRKGNESLLEGHPLLNRVWVWNKKKGKYRALWKLGAEIRKERYDWVVNCQRFGASGVLTVFSGAKQTVGFDKNPFSRLFSVRVPHVIDGRHEVVRNLSLIEHLTDPAAEERPRLYPSDADKAQAEALKPANPYVCIAPTSVWFTKQFPLNQWARLINRIPFNTTVCLLGGPSDREACETLSEMVERTGVRILAGQLSLLASAALMEKAEMCYVNDSAPMHLASSVNAPTTAVFCSTVPRFGFGPLSDVRFIAQVEPDLSCRPCGLHGKNACPEGHFRCAENIAIEKIELPKC